MSENKTSSSFAFARSLANVIGDEIGVGATVEATFAPIYEVGSDRGLKIEIAPVARRAVSTTRDGWSSALVAQIAIRKHIGTERDFERIDELIALEERIEKALLLRRVPLADGREVVVESVETKAIYDAASLTNQGVFVGVLEVVASTGELYFC